jgi:hypothetical protein
MQAAGTAKRRRAGALHIRTICVIGGPDTAFVWFVCFVVNTPMRKQGCLRYGSDYVC